MKQLVAFLALVMVSQANAQGVVQYAQPGQPLPQAPAKKRTMIYDERSNELVEVQPEVETVNGAPAQTNPIYILNNQNQKFQGYQGQAQTHVQEQPLTVVEDAPLKNSAADGMRRKRQETEAQTEDGIVQALERARMEDEVRRRDRFNSAIGTGSQQQEPVSQSTAPQYPVYQPVAPVQVQQVAPVQPVVIAPPAEPEEEKVDIRSEIRAALKESNTKPENPTTYYVSGQVGLGKYPDVVNVKGSVATGFSAGVVTPERVIAEGSFLFSKYEMEDVRNGNIYYPRIVDLKQYNVGATVKYQLIPGRFQPLIGVTANYVRRTYDQQGYQFRTSDAFDLGAVAGLDLQITDNFGIGVDFRYLTNIAYRDNSEGTRQSFVYPQLSDKPVEKLDYYTGSITGKLTF